MIKPVNPAISSGKSAVAQSGAGHRMQVVEREAPLFRRFASDSARREAAIALYNALVAQARNPAFYRSCGVPDSVDGRFELIVLHAFMFFNRFSKNNQQYTDFTQEVFDVMFLDMDRSLREMGAGDLGVGKRVRRMTEAFYGRVRAYEAALAGTESALAEALRRNLYGTAMADARQLAAMAAYLRRSVEKLKAQAAGELLAGRIAFAEVPALGPEIGAEGDPQAASPDVPAGREEGGS